MSAAEQQEEETEALGSIYDGDGNFAVIESTKFQYKFGEDGHSKSFIIEVSWPSDYPEILPDINMDLFYNKHIIPSVKQKIKDFALSEAENFIGMPMTFTIFECVKENDDLLSDQPDEIEKISENLEETTIKDNQERSGKEPSPRKENLTKAQKRRMWNKGGLETDDRPRGWNWVDVIRHLSQSGPQS